MEKVESKFRFNEMNMVLDKETKEIMCFTSEDNNYCVITDKKRNVLVKITADCAQNQGFLEVL